MKKLFITAALAVASLVAHAGPSTSEAGNPELVRMSRQAIAALACARYATYMIPAKGEKVEWPLDADAAKEATRLRAYGLKSGRAFIDRIKEVTDGDARSQLPIIYSWLDYSQGTEFALGQLVSMMDDGTVQKLGNDLSLQKVRASNAYSAGNCGLIGFKP